jgi:WhiB family transcriptional regulator, redox-sensing transcriptional regulator
VNGSANTYSNSLQDWLERAACRGEDGQVFFPPATGETRAQRQMREHVAKAICQNCEVRTQCLSHAVATDERYGIWGGLNDLERRALQRSA